VSHNFENYIALLPEFSRKQLVYVHTHTHTHTRARARARAYIYIYTRHFFN